MIPVSGAFGTCSARVLGIYQQLYAPELLRAQALAKLSHLSCQFYQYSCFFTASRMLLLEVLRWSAGFEGGVGSPGSTPAAKIRESPANKS